MNPEPELRAIWTAKGISEERQAELIADITAKAAPAYLAGVFQTEPTEQGNQYVIPGCEKDKTRGPKQMDFF